MIDPDFRIFFDFSRENLRSNFDWVGRCSKDCLDLGCRKDWIIPDLNNSQKTEREKLKITWLIFGIIWWMVDKKLTHILVSSINQKSIDDKKNNSIRTFELLLPVNRETFKIIHGNSVKKQAILKHYVWLLLGFLSFRFKHTEILYFSLLSRRNNLNSATQPFFNIFWKFHFWEVDQG